MSRSHSSQRPTWQPTPIAFAPVPALISSAAATQASCLRLAITTVAPRCANAVAIWRPRPRLPPVISATLSSSSNICSPPRVVLGTSDRQLVGDHLAELRRQLLEAIVERSRADRVRQLGVALEPQAFQPPCVARRVLFSQAQLTLDDREHVDRDLEVVTKPSLERGLDLFGEELADRLEQRG